MAVANWRRVMTPMNSELEERKYRLEVAKVLLDEWKWRHQHCWKLLTRGVVIAITVGLAPYAWLLKEGPNFLKTYSGVWVLMFPVISLIIVHIALILFAGEYVRCRPSLAKYNEVMEKYSPNPMDRWPTKWPISVAQQTIMFTGFASTLLALGDAYVLTFAAGTGVDTNSLSSKFWLICIAGIALAFFFDYQLMSWTRKTVANRIAGEVEMSSLGPPSSGPHAESPTAENKVVG